MLERLASNGIGFATVTLHTGVSSLEEPERPYDEPFTVPEEAAKAVVEAKAAGRRVIAVGTTVVRALETAAGDDGRVRDAAIRCVLWQRRSHLTLPIGSVADGRGSWGDCGRCAGDNDAPPKSENWPPSGAASTIATYGVAP